MAPDYETMKSAQCGVRSAACAAVVLGLAVLGTLSSTLAAGAGPTRLVSLVPAVTEMFFAIGAGKEVVGVSSFDKFPAEVANLPRVGALVDPDFERILSLKPDLVAVYGSQTDLIARLDRARIPLFHYKHAGLADITMTIRELGRRIERAPAADALATRIERDLDAIRRSVAGKPRPRTALLFEREPGTLRGIYASGGIGFMHDMLLVAGGQDVFDDVKRQSLQVTAEVLLARAPDVIVEVQAWAEWPADRAARERAVWNALPSVPAVKTGRIHFVRDDRLVVPGPRVAEAVRVLADAVHAGSKPPAPMLRWSAEASGEGGDRASSANYEANTRSSLFGMSLFSKDSEKNRSSAARPRVP